MPVTLEQVGPRLYLKDLPIALKDRAKEALGMTGKNFDWDRKQWYVGAAKRAALEKFLAEVNDPAAPPPQEDPDKVTLVAKGRHKGRTVYVRCFSGDRTRCRVATLPAADGTFLCYWKDVGTGEDQVEVVKSYPEREERGSYGRPTGRTVKQTLGGIVRFIAKAERERKAAADGTAETKVCWECGRTMTEFQCRSNRGDWSDSYCGC